MQLELNLPASRNGAVRVGAAMMVVRVISFGFSLLRQVHTEVVGDIFCTPSIYLLPKKLQPVAPMGTEIYSDLQRLGKMKFLVTES